MAGLRLPRRRGGARRAGPPLSSSAHHRPSGGEIADGLPLQAARNAVASLARVTPLLPVPSLRERVGRPVWVKLENLQTTGSFKLRGAAARLSALTGEGRVRGVVACSSGNHGRAVAWVAGRTGIPATIFVPSWVDPVKLEGIRSQGAEAVLAGDSYDEAEERAVARACEEGRPFVSAYDDPHVIAGQGTLATEILAQLGRGEPEGWGAEGASPAAVLASLSGGGLVGGMAAAFRAAGKSEAEGGPALVAVSAERAAVMRESVRHGHPVSLPEEETLASALAGGIGRENRWSFPLVQDLIQHHVSVTEHEIKRAIVFAYNNIGVVIEGGGAVPLAAVLAGRVPRDLPGDGPLVVVVSGGNLDPTVLRELMA